MPKLMDAYGAALDAQRSEWSHREELGAAEAEVFRARRSGDAQRLAEALAARRVARVHLCRAAAEHDARFADFCAVETERNRRSAQRAPRQGRGSQVKGAQNV